MTGEERDALRAAWLDAASALPALRAEVLTVGGPTTLVVHGTGGITRLTEPGLHTHRASLVARALAAAVNALPELLDAADERDRLRAALETAERWLRTINANPYTSCPHASWAAEAQGDVAVARERTPTPPTT